MVATQEENPPFLQRLFKRVPRSEEDSKNEKLLDNFMSVLTNAFFGSFARIVTAPDMNAVKSKEPLEHDIQLTLADFRRALEQKISAQLPKHGTSSNTILAQVHQVIKPPLTFSSAFKRVKEAFPRDEAEMQRFATSPAPDKSSVVSGYGGVSTLIAALARALQDVALSTPETYYSNIGDAVPEEVHAALQRVLNAIEFIRLSHRIEKTLVRDINTATATLNMQIAHVDGEGYVWLPFHNLVTAPLSGDDLHFYARGQDEAFALARYIIRGDGVFLITGYRGVGKSTFINQSLTLCCELEKSQREDPPWRVIPVVVSLAKAAGVSNILRLCIRKLHETLLESDNNALLTKAEKKFLSLAYYRAAYKFSIQQDASAETLKHIEAQVGWSIKFGNFLPTSAGNVFPSLLPNLDTSTKASKEWHKKVGSTIALLDYDEDRAEDDIVDLIKMLASSQLPSTRRERLKLVFVFDEMDKMAKEEQINLVSQLKNLFLARYAVFLLVTSKDFYYLWLEERKKEDAVLASYFSGIKSVPLFTSKETTALIERLIAIDNVPSLRTNDRTFISSVAQYLTYRARGVPRDIVREMQAIQKWTKEGLQPYITSRSEQYNTILIYAQLQLVLERVLDNTSGSLIPPAIATTSMTGSTDSQIPEVASTLHYEHIWTNEGRHEQVRQGLYILIEELLDLGGLEINPDSEILKRLREENFKMVSPNDFKTLLNRLISQLESVPLPNAPGNTPIEPNAVSEIKLFSIAAPENGFKVVQVAESFYQITGRSVSSPDSSRAQIATVYSLDKIREMLKREEFLPRRRALSALQQNVQTLPVDINMLLCRLFIGVNNSPTVRRDAVSLLQGSNACLTIFEVEKEALNRFLLSEVDTQLLQEFMRLVTGALSSDSSKRHEGAAMLLQLLARYKPEEVDDVQMISLKRTEPLYGEIIANLAKMPDEDVLDACVSSLNRRDDVPGDVLPSLIDMAKRYDRNLLELFANLDFNAVSADTLQTILKTMTYRQLMDTWSSVISRKQQPFAQQILAAILQQRSIYSSSSPETNTIAEWLNSPQPDAIDRRIIAAALAASPAIRSLLEKMIKEENKGRLADSKPDATSSTSTSGPGFRVSGGAIAFMVVLAALIAYATVPFDLPPRDTIVQHLVARTLELVYVYSGVAALVILGFLIFTRSNSVALIISFVITSVLTAAGLYFQIVSFPLAMTFLGQVFLVGLLLVIVVAFGVWMFFSDVVPNVV